MRIIDEHQTIHITHDDGIISCHIEFCLLWVNTNKITINYFPKIPFNAPQIRSDPKSIFDEILQTRTCCACD